MGVFKSIFLVSATNSKIRVGSCMSNRLPRSTMKSSRACGTSPQVPPQGSCMRDWWASHLNLFPLLLINPARTHLSAYHFSDECDGFDWHTRYKIIKGICCGLHYLHEECRPQNNNAFIIHLDLKPANILLDENMVPKLADFGLSKLVCDNQTQDTSNFLGTM